MMKKRLQKIEEEAAFLKEMQAKNEKEMTDNAEGRFFNVDLRVLCKKI